jgi:hypothetical protein
MGTTGGTYGAHLAQQQLHQCWCSSRCCCLQAPRRRPWVKKAVIGGVIAAVFLGFGILAGFYIGKAAKPSSGSSAAPAPSLSALQLPPPGSAAAAALMADPNTPRKCMCASHLPAVQGDAATLHAGHTQPHCMAPSISQSPRWCIHAPPACHSVGCAC